MCEAREYITFEMKDVISFADFARLDLRVGRILKVENIDGSRNLLRMSVDLGPDYGVKNILAGIKIWYEPKDLEGKKFIFVANLEPKIIMGEESQVMMLAADIDGKCNLIPVNKKIPEGTIIR